MFDDFIIEDPDAACRDGSHRQLFVTRQAQLPDQEHVERRGQDPGDLRGDRDAAPGQAEDEAGFGEALQHPGLHQVPAEYLAGVAPVPEPGPVAAGSHAHVA